MIKVTETEEGFEYLLDDELHRANGPAFGTALGSWQWWLHGLNHRYYGPQGYWVNTPCYTAWYIHGVQIKYDFER